MNIKKLITLALLTGILTASLASCVTTKKKDEDNTTGRTYITTEQGGNNPVVPSTDPSTLEYLTVSETVYVKASSAKFYDASDTTKFSTLKRFSEENATKLTRIGKSTTGTWSKVTDGKNTYYVLSSALTTADLLAEKFTVCNPAATMYVTNAQSLNVRQYPAAEDTKSTAGVVTDQFPTVIGSLKLSDAVSVLAKSTDGKWAKVQYQDDKKETVIGYVSTAYLSTSKDSSGINDYLQYFTPFGDEIKMYVAVETANVRKTPTSNGVLIADAPAGIKKGTEVIVIAEGTVDETKWYMVKWADKVASGSAQTYSTCFIAAKLLTTKFATSVADYLTLYPYFTEFSKTLYVSADNAFGRSTPDASSKSSDKENNICKTLKKADTVKVVAIGTDSSNSTWCLIQDTATSYYFIKYSILTTDSTGATSNVPLSLDMLLKLYPNFTATTKNATANGKINALNIPDSLNGTAIKQIASGASVKIVASGYVTDGFIQNNWYIIEDTDGACYFVGQNQVTLK